MPLVGFLLLAILVWRLDRQAMAQALRALSPSAIALALGFFFLNVMVKAVRWQRLLVAQDIDVPWVTALLGFFSGSFYGSVTIGRLGELTRADILVQRGVGLGQALSSCLFDRVLDLAALLFVGGVVGAFLLGDERMALTVALALIVAAPLIWGVVRRWENATEADDGGGPVGRVARIKRVLVDLVRESARLMRPAVLAEAAIWTALGWTGHFATIWALAAGLGLTASKLTLTAAASFAALTTLIPITFQGVGTRELVFAAALAPEGVTQEAAVVLALLAVTVMTGGNILFGGPATLVLSARRTR